MRTGISLRCAVAHGTGAVLVTGQAPAVAASLGQSAATLGTAQGMVNMGGFVASLLVMQVMGGILEASGGYSFDSFRAAWAVQYAVWALATVGILITRHKARKRMRLEQLDAAAVAPGVTR